MRFLPHEHAAFTAALIAAGRDPAHVLFVKRRGRLHVQLPDRVDDFSFFREKSAKLDASGKWQDRVDYFITPGKKEPCDWGAVLRAFEAWLKG